MLEVIQIDNKIDFYIERKDAFFISIQNAFKGKEVNEAKLNKLTDFIDYALKSKYKIIKSESNTDIVFIFCPKKMNKKDIEIAYKITDKMIELTKNQISVEVYELESLIKTSIKDKKPSKKENEVKKIKELKQTDQTEQWFNKR
ncbi:hypothetical protein GW932_02905 [archaeon]|nr:hypothetical protein [archaeon]